MNSRLFILEHQIKALLKAEHTSPETIFNLITQYKQEEEKQ